jgi:hypothetical protein
MQVKLKFAILFFSLFNWMDYKPKWNKKDPTRDTEWNDILRKKGIIPEKEKEITEEQIIDIVERTVQEKLNKNHLADKELDELDELEDEEDERVLAEYRFVYFTNSFTNRIF